MRRLAAEPQGAGKPTKLSGKRQLGPFGAEMEEEIE